MLAAATWVELKEGSALTIVYALEAAGVTLAAYAVLRDLSIAYRFCLLLIAPIALSLQSI